MKIERASLLAFALTSLSLSCGLSAQTLFSFSSDFSDPSSFEGDFNQNATGEGGLHPNSIYS